MQHSTYEVCVNSKENDFTKKSVLEKNLINVVASPW